MRDPAPALRTEAPTCDADLPDDAVRALALRYAYLGPAPATIYVLASQLPHYLARGYTPTGNSRTERFNTTTLEMEPPK